MKQTIYYLAAHKDGIIVVRLYSVKARLTQAKRNAIALHVQSDAQHREELIALANNPRTFEEAWDMLVDLTGADYGTTWEEGSQRLDLNPAAVLGRKRSKAKAEASRANGAKGGRPRKALTLEFSPAVQFTNTAPAIPARPAQRVKERLAGLKASAALFKFNADLEHAGKEEAKP